MVRCLIINIIYITVHKYHLYPRTPQSSTTFLHGFKIHRYMYFAKIFSVPLNFRIVLARIVFYFTGHNIERTSSFLSNFCILCMFSKVIDQGHRA